MADTHQRTKELFAAQALELTIHDEVNILSGSDPLPINELPRLELVDVGVLHEELERAQ